MSSSRVLEDVEPIMLAATPLGRTGWGTGEVFYVTGGTRCGRPHMAVARGV